jgi:hypothetical protein
MTTTTMGVVEMSWNLAGTFYENCSCDAICPCTWSNMARRATNDDCRAALLFQFESGEVGGVDLSGTTVAMVIQTPAMTPEVNWKAGLIVDHDASDAQVEVLGKVFSGEMGGPPAGLAPLIGEFLGVERMPVSITHDGNRHHITVGGALDYDLTKHVTPEGAPVELTNIVVHPAGPTLEVAHADAVTNNVFGIGWSGDGLSSFSNAFAWAG